MQRRQPKADPRSISNARRHRDPNALMEHGESAAQTAAARLIPPPAAPPAARTGALDGHVYRGHQTTARFATRQKQFPLHDLVNELRPVLAEKSVAHAVDDQAHAWKV